MTVCITGGTGYIGNLLASRILETGRPVRILTRREMKMDAREYFRADLTDPFCNLDGLLKDVDVIIHCAGETKDQSVMRDVHVNGISTLLRAVGLHIARTQKPLHWVQLSSVGAYGPGKVGEEREITERSETAPVGEYETSKTMADELLIKFAATEPLFSWTILRPSIVIGKEMKNQSVRSLIHFIRKRLFFYIGSYSTVATYIHVDDVVRALTLCAQDQRARGQIFNLSNDCLLFDIVREVAHRYGIRPPVLCVPELPLRIAVKLTSVFMPSPLNSQRIDALVCKTWYPSLKIKQLLGFESAHSIPHSMATLFDD